VDGRPVEENYLPHRFATQKGPLGIGLRYGYDAKRIWDAEMDTRWGIITNPRLKTTTTVPAEVAAVEFNGFFHSAGEFFMFGKGTATGATADEALLYFDGTNWADTTLKDDIGGTGTMIVTSGVEHAGRTYVALRGTVDTGTSGVKIARSNAGSTSVWSRQSAAGTTNGIGARQPYGLETDGTLMYLAAFDGDNTITVRESPAGSDGVAWNGFTANPTILSSAAPRKAVMFRDGASSASVLDYWLTTAEGLYQVDISAESFTKHVPFQHPESAHSGQMVVTGRGLVYTDGPNAFLANWSDGRIISEELGPACLDDGLPLAKQGDITGVAYDNIRDELAVCIGGGASGKNGTIYIYGFATHLWSCQYKNSTADKVIFALAYSTETDGVSRLHFAEDNATANDSDAFYLNYISSNPVIETNATFATAGTISTSDFGGFSEIFRKMFGKWHVRADDLTSGESLGVKFGADGGALGSSQSITSGTRNTIWTDGTGTAVGTDALDIRTEITTASDANGDTPKIRSFGYSYLVFALNVDDTPIETFEFTVDLSTTAQGNPDLKGIESIRAGLRTSMAKRTLLSLVYGTDTDGFGGGTKVIIEALSEDTEITQADTISQSPGPGFVRVVARQVGLTGA